MLDTDTFLTVLYVLADDFAHSERARAQIRVKPGPAASLSVAEVLTLAAFSQWSCFPSERAFYRFASRRLRHLFPSLPDRSQFNRLVRTHERLLSLLVLWLADKMKAKECLFEALDGTGVPTRNCKRRGVGWLSEYTALGKHHRMGWFHGFYLLLAVNPEGVLTGFAIAPGNAKEQPLAEQFFRLRQQPHPWLPSVGEPAVNGDYIADRGFSGPLRHAVWRQQSNAWVYCEPQKGHRDPHVLPALWCNWLRSARQIVETVIDKLLHSFRLEHERPHDLTGFQARIAAKACMHNAAMLINRSLGRPALAFADVWSF